MEILLGLIATGIFSFLAGFIISGVLKIDIKFSKKDEYELKVKMMEDLIEKLEEELEATKTVETPKEKYHPLDMFPANLPRDYGLPRSLSEEE